MNGHCTIDPAPGRRHSRGAYSAAFTTTHIIDARPMAASMATSPSCNSCISSCMNGHCTIDGTVAQLIFQNPDNGYTVLRMVTADGEPVPGQQPGQAQPLLGEAAVHQQRRAHRDDGPGPLPGPSGRGGLRHGDEARQAPLPAGRSRPGGD